MPKSRDVHPPHDRDLGIYSIIWNYSTFEELNKYRGQGWSGGTYLLFTLVPFLNIVGMATPFLLSAYTGRMYEEDGRPKPITGWHGCWLLVPLAGPFIYFFGLQGKLNEFWQSKGAAPP